MTITAVEEPRTGSTEPALPAVTNRMAIAMLALFGLLISIYMSAYKMGLFGEIYCGTGGCETVQNSPWASFFGMPVPYIGFAGYGAMFVLAILGIQPRFARDRRIAALLFAGATIGLGFSAYLTYLEAAVIHAWCRWCIASAVLAVLLFLAALPEARRLRGS